MSKNKVKTSILISIFAPYLSLPLLAMDEFELNVGQHSRVALKTMPADNFRRSSLNLNNITSYERLKDIKPQLLKSIHHMIETKHKANPFVINRIEYNYPYVPGKKLKDWQHNVDIFMKNIADGINVVNNKVSQNECRCDFVTYCNNRQYSIEVTFYNKRVETREEGLARLFQNPQQTPQIDNGFYNGADEEYSEDEDNPDHND